MSIYRISLFLFLAALISLPPSVSSSQVDSEVASNDQPFAPVFVLSRSQYKELPSAMKLRYFLKLSDALIEAESNQIRQGVEIDILQEISWMRLLVEDLSAAQKGAPCLVCGFSSTVGSNGRCTPKDKVTLSSGKSVSCGGTSVLCNPSMFGDNDGKGVCIPKKGGNDFTARAFKATLAKACKEPSSDTCKKLLKNLGEHQTDKNTKEMNEFLRAKCGSSIQEWGSEKDKVAFESILKSHGDASGALAHLRSLDGIDPKSPESQALKKIADGPQDDKDPNFRARNLDHIRQVEERLKKSEELRVKCGQKNSGIDPATCQQAKAIRTLDQAERKLLDARKAYMSALEARENEKDPNKWDKGTFWTHNGRVKAAKEEADRQAALVKEKREELKKSAQGQATNFAKRFKTEDENARKQRRQVAAAPPRPAPAATRRVAAVAPATTEKKKTSKDFAKTCMDLAYVMRGHVQAQGGEAPLELGNR